MPPVAVGNMHTKDQFNQAWRESLERVKKEQAAKQQKPSE